MTWTQAVLHSSVVVKLSADPQWRTTLVPPDHLRTQNWYSAGAQLDQGKNTSQKNKTRIRNITKCWKGNTSIFIYRQYNCLHKNPRGSIDNLLELMSSSARLLNKSSWFTKYLQKSIRNVTFQKSHSKFNQNYKVPIKKSKKGWIRYVLRKFTVLSWRLLQKT